MNEKKLRIAVVGYGKMGREIVNSAEDFNIEIAGTIDVSTSEASALEILKDSDVAVIFTSPQGAFLQVSRALNAGIPVLCGTTGWENEIHTAKLLCNQLGGTLLIANNCSLGVHLFFILNSYLNNLMQKFPNYKISISETHHSTKQDKPSGTAIELANQILKTRDNLNAWALQENNPADTDIPITSLREGKVIGRHTVEYSSEVDTISIRHNARSRAGFVNGAILAAKFIADKKGIFSMQDVIEQELKPLISDISDNNK